MSNIKDILQSNGGEQVAFKAVLADKKLVPKASGGNYLSLSLADSSSRLDTPIWDNPEHLFETLESGCAYFVTGTINKWNSSTQIKNIHLRKLNQGDFDPSEFIGSYDIPQELINSFRDVINSMSDPYKTIAKAATGACGFDNKLFKEFLSCPSAEKHHGNKIGGLFLHTMGVLESLNNSHISYLSVFDIYGDINQCINRDRLMLKAILHDIMKMNEYEYSTIIRRKPGKSLNHLVEGVSYLNKINEQCGLILDEEEVDNIGYAIVSHHGQYGPYEPKTLEDTLLHLADMIDSRIVGEMEKSV